MAVFLPDQDEMRNFMYRIRQHPALDVWYRLVMLLQIWSKSNMLTDAKWWQHFTRVHAGFSGVGSCFVWCFVDHCVPFCPYYCGHCVVRTSIYRFWFPLWYFPILYMSSMLSYLRYLCLLANSGVQHILCCVFCFVSLRLVSCVWWCPTGIVLCFLLCFVWPVFCQFLWIVNSW